jgi:hypothetical protein
LAESLLSLHSWPEDFHVPAWKSSWVAAGFLACSCMVSTSLHGWTDGMSLLLYCNKLLVFSVWLWCAWVFAWFLVSAWMSWCPLFLPASVLICFGCYLAEFSLSLHGWLEDFYVFTWMAGVCLYMDELKALRPCMMSLIVCLYFGWWFVSVWMSCCLLFLVGSVLFVLDVPWLGFFCLCMGVLKISLSLLGWLIARLLLSLHVWVYVSAWRSHWLVVIICFGHSLALVFILFGGGL